MRTENEKLEQKTRSALGGREYLAAVCVTETVQGSDAAVRADERFPLRLLESEPHTPSGLAFPTARHP
eukprot:116619-Rhodomonas_salina.3